MARRAWSALSADRRTAVVAALWLIVATVLPWYRRSARGSAHTAAVSVLQAEPLLGAAIIVLGAFVVGTLLARGSGAAFHLPGGDGRVVAFAGLWAAALVVAAMLHGPSVAGDAGAGTSQTLYWGAGVALAIALVLTGAGWWMRRASLSLPPP